MWGGGIIKNTRVTGCKEVDWIHLAENRGKW
jgi:hypothetical protein